MYLVLYYINYDSDHGGLLMEEFDELLHARVFASRRSGFVVKAVDDEDSD